MAIVQAVRADNFIQYDGSNAQEVAGVISSLVPGTTHSRDANGVLTLHTGILAGDLVMNPSDWIQVGSGQIMFDADFQANYVRLSTLTP